MIRLGVQLHLNGAKARIYKYIRASGRCPSCDFLRDLDSKTANKFAGSFDALSQLGAQYYNPQRFKGLIGNGKPLWEFKEHGQRLYCCRYVEGERVCVTLFNGWDKDKEGKSKEEVQRVLTAKTLLAEFLAEYPNGNVPGGGR